MNGLKRTWLKLQGNDCYSCTFSEVFRSNGDGQVSRLHSYCRNPASPHHDRPIPAGQWCDAWQRGSEAPKATPEERDKTGLTM